VKQCYRNNKAIVDIRLRPRGVQSRPNFAAYNRPVERLQPIVCPCRVHAAAWTSPIRNCYEC